MIAHRLSSELARVGEERGHADFFARATDWGFSLLHVHIQFGDIGYGCRVSKLAACDSDLAQVAGMLIDRAAAEVAKFSAESDLVEPNEEWLGALLLRALDDEEGVSNE